MSQMVRIKICGITNWRDAKAACDFGATALGFNFYEKSPRVVSPAQASEIISRQPKTVESVGVFVNWSAEAIIALGHAVRLDAALIETLRDRSRRILETSDND